jgi:hypothetical protein
MHLWDLINRAESQFRGWPTFDDFSFSLPRLIARGLVTVSRDGQGNLRIKATDEAFDLKARFRDTTPEMAYMIKAVGAVPLHVAGPEDRSLGRFADLGYDEWRAAEVRVGAP